MADKSTIALYFSVAVVLFSLVQIYNSGFRIHKEWKARLNRPLVKAPVTGTKVKGDLNDTSGYHIQSLHLYISNAHLDCRRECHVRLPGIQPSSRDFALLCIFQHKGRSFQSQVTVERIFPWWPPNTTYIAVLYSCALPSNQKMTFSEVRIVNQFHYGSGNHRLDAGKDSVVIPLREFQPSSKVDTIVCLKSTDEYLDPNLFLEWIEYYRLQGINHVYMYDGGIMQNNDSTTLLDFYQKLGILTLVKFNYFSKVMSAITWTHPLDNVQRFALRQQMQLVSLNDCFYQFHTKAKRILLVDLDELLLPSRSETLIQMFDRGFHDFSNYGNLLFKNSWYFLDQQKSIPTGSSLKSFFPLPHPLLRTPMSEKQPKGVCRTDAVLTINWHCAIHLLRAVDLEPFVIINSIDYGLLHHFGKSCEDKFQRKTCNKMVGHLEEDSAVFVYQDLVKQKVQFVKQKIKEKL